MALHGQTDETAPGKGINMRRRMIQLALSFLLSAMLFLNGTVQVNAAGTTVYGGVDYGAVYDFDFYVGQYADLKAVYGNNPAGALQHFVMFGMNEGRQAAAHFNVEIYKNRYADLKQAFGNNNRSYYMHYIMFGQAENRSASGGAVQQRKQQQQQQQNQTSQALPAGSSLQARAKLAEIGRDLGAAYNWSRSLKWTNQYASPDAGTRAMANTGFSTGTGGCYVMAATFYEMARDLGYDAHQMSGYVPRRGGGLAIHSWVEVVVNGVTYVVDPDYAYETGGNGYLIQYGQPGTWRYQSYYRMN